MDYKYLSGEDLYYSFVSGAREVIKNKKSLNEINVFPIADGDTGSNLASTMHAIIEDAKVMDSARNTMSSIAEAALVGARGNSGIIMAQYINGLFIGLSDDQDISIIGFAEAAQQAVTHAYNAISNPVEGTIITVMREWAEAVNSFKYEAESFYELLKKPLDMASVALKNTASTMAVLRNTHVVDSGAKGFVHFVEGITEFVRTGDIQHLEVQEEVAAIEELFSHDVQEMNYRFCTEVLIYNEKGDLDIPRLKAGLDNLGDSLIIAGNSNKARIHIHTNEPHEVVAYLRKKGTLLQQKADDMKRQYEAGYKRKFKIALITDSIADIPKELLDYYQVHVLPLNLVLEGSSYLDNVTMTPQLLYSLLDQVDEYPSSAQPSPKVVENLYRSLLNHYDEIMVITVAKEQSGTYNLFTKVAQEVAQKKKRIQVIDSKQNSAAEGLLVLKAAELIESGKGLDEIVSEIKRLREKTKILVSVKTLKYMVRSGRISHFTGFAGKLINLKPVVSIDETGKGKIEDKSFSLRGNTKKIMTILKDAYKQNQSLRYVIVHANDPNRAEEYRKQCVQILGREPEYIMSISTIVGISAGVGSVAVAFIAESGDQNE